jgi:hypothetical protein
MVCHVVMQEGGENLRHSLTDMLFAQMTALESLWIIVRTIQAVDGNSHFPVARKTTKPTVCYVHKTDAVVK